LIASIQFELDDASAQEFAHDIADRVSTTRASGVVLDISAVEIVDSFLGRMIADIAATNRLLGARTALVGMQPAVAITMVELGLELPGVLTAADLEAGVTLLRGAQPA
jgi:rsbT antagonist protein RsbS